MEEFDTNTPSFNNGFKVGVITGLIIVVIIHLFF